MNVDIIILWIARIIFYTGGAATCLLLVLWVFHQLGSKIIRNAYGVELLWHIIKRMRTAEHRAYWDQSFETWKAGPQKPKDSK